MDEYVRMRKSTLTAIGVAIRSKEGTTELIPPLEMPERIGALGGGGIPNEWVKNINLTSLNVFGNSTAEITLPNATDLSNLASPDISEKEDERINVTVEHLTINAPLPQSSAMSLIATSNYGPDATLRHLTLNVDFRNAQNCRYFIRNCRALKVIDGTPIDFSSATNITGAFQGMYDLQEIRFKGTIGLSLLFDLAIGLSYESIVSIMSCLSPSVTGKTLTLTTEAVDAAFETSEGAADGSTSAKWLALVAAHSNWTISLV